MGKGRAAGYGPKRDVCMRWDRVRGDGRSGSTIGSNRRPLISAVRGKRIHDNEAVDPPSGLQVFRKKRFATGPESRSDNQ